MPKAKKKDEKVVTNLTSIHVVYFSCPDCGDEVGDVKLCNSCGKPMRVINVVEKFGEEAERFLAKVEKAVKEEIANDKDAPLDDEPNIILMGDDDALENDGGIDPTDDDDGELSVIFGGSDDEENTEPKTAKAQAEDLSDVLEILDTEEEDLNPSEDFGFDDMPEL